MENVRIYESRRLLAVTGPAIRPGGAALTRRAADYCRLPPGARVLDVGCGTGATVELLRNRYRLAAFGLDWSAALLCRAARQQGQPPCLVRGRAEQLPVADSSLQAVFCECVLSLCAEPAAVLAEMNRVLVPGGRLVLADLYKRRNPAPAERESCSDPTFSGRPAQSCLQGAVNRDLIQQRLSAAGFRQLFWEDHSSLLKRLAAQLVLSFGSMQSFWAQAGGCPGMASAQPAALEMPGYFLVIASKYKESKNG